MSKKEISKRYILFIIGLFFSALGVALTKHASLGVSPISSVANVLSIKFSFLSLGNWLIIWNCILIFGQILILKKAFNPIQLLQIPLSFIFGWFTDFGMYCVSHIFITGYIMRLALVFLGTATLGFGICLTVIANVVMNSGEAFVKAISDKLSAGFGTVKIAFDVSCVITSVILSLLFFSGQIQGTREGTIITAICTGTVVEFFSKLLKPALDKALKDR